MYQCTCMLSLSHVQLVVMLWTAINQAVLSMEFSRQEHWSGLPFSTPKCINKNLQIKKKKKNLQIEE